MMGVYIFHVGAFASHSARYQGCIVSISPDAVDVIPRPHRSRASDPLILPGTAALFDVVVAIIVIIPALRIADGRVSASDRSRIGGLPETGGGRHVGTIGSWLHCPHHGARRHRHCNAGTEEIGDGVLAAGATRLAGLVGSRRDISGPQQGDALVVKTPPRACSRRHHGDGLSSLQSCAPLNFSVWVYDVPIFKLFGDEGLVRSKK